MSQFCLGVPAQKPSSWHKHMVLGSVKAKEGSSFLNHSLVQIGTISEQTQHKHNRVHKRPGYNISAAVN